MRAFKKAVMLFLSCSLVLGGLSSPLWAEDTWVRHDPQEDEYNIADILFARPAAVVAGILGTGLFIVSLPFTLPTKSTDAAAETFIRRPFKFAFVREFPDENVLLEMDPKLRP